MLGSIVVTDINKALLMALPMLLTSGQRHTAASVANARPTVEWPGLFVTEYTHPNRNVLFDPVRDANPFFHYLESMWILAGRNDVRTLAAILPRMADYSDNGDTFHGAYGFRLRRWEGGWSGIDQIEEAIKILAASPTSRQVVMSIWDPERDLGAKTKDMPCNDMVMLKVREGRLNLTVSNRSNDVIWGCYGANAVQFSMLQMYIAARLGVGLGTYCQVSDSFHVYDDNPYWQKFLEKKHTAEYPVWRSQVETYNHCYKELGDANLFDSHPDMVLPELQQFFNMLETDDASEGNSFIHPDRFISTAAHDAACMWVALQAYRAKKFNVARETLEQMRASDWRLGANLWLDRRQGAQK